MSTPMLLYSTNSWLAYTISQTYFNEAHYVWCNRYPNSNWLPLGMEPMPPSSSPGAIYLALHADIRAHDRHSAKIEQNRNGLRNGVQSKRAAGVITEAQVAEINAIIDAAELREFRPLLYVIPYSPVVNLLKPVAISERASLYHEEYLIEQLPRFLFEVVELLEV